MKYGENNDGNNDIRKMKKVVIDIIESPDIRRRRAVAEARSANFEIEVFDSRNTSTPQVANRLYTPTTWFRVKADAKKMSLTNPFKVVAHKGVHPDHAFVAYEKGEAVEWTAGEILA